MGNNTGTRGKPLINTYQRGGIQSKQQLNNTGTLLDKINVDGGDIFVTPKGGIDITIPLADNRYNFQLIKDTTYEPTAKERRISIRGGIFSRAASGPSGLNEMLITAEGGYDFLAAGGAAWTDLAVCNDTIAEGVTWVVWLALYSTATSSFNSVAPTNLIAKYSVGDAEDYTVGRPTDPETAGILNYARVLGTVTNTNGKLSFKQEWRGGNIKDFMMIPDGKPQTVVSSTVETLDYIASSGSPENIGLLQDRQAHELLVTGNTVSQYSGDQIAPWIDYVNLGVSQKKYARYDSSNAGAGLWGVAKAGRSLEIKDVNPSNWEYIVQLYDFLTMPNPVTGAFDAVTDSGVADGEYMFLARHSQAADAHTLKYVDLSNMNVATADLADDLAPDTPFAHTDLADMPDLTGTNQDQDFSYLRRYDTAADATYENDAEYRNKGAMYASTLGLATVAGGAPDGTNVWSLAGFKYALTNGATLVADTNHTFSAGKVIVSDVTQATTGGLGSVQLAGGLYGAGACIFENSLDTGAAGQFYKSGRAIGAMIGTNNMAGLFFDPFNDVQLADGTYAVNASKGAINANDTTGFSVTGGYVGQDITNWFRKGILSGVNVVEKTYAQLLSTDKILVIPA